MTTTEVRRPPPLCSRNADRLPNVVDNNNLIAVEMLRLATGLLRVSLRTSKVMLRAAAPRMMMCQAKPPVAKGIDTTSKLSQQLEEEIKYEKENKPDSAEVVKILEKNGWAVKQDGTSIELKKQTGDKTVFLTFNVRSPQAAKQEEEGEAKKEGE